MNANKMLKHTRNLSICGIKIKSRTKLYMSYLGVNESEAFLKSVSIVCATTTRAISLPIHCDVHQGEDTDGRGTRGYEPRKLTEEQPKPPVLVHHKSEI